MGSNQQWIMVDECVSAYLDMSEQSVHKQFKVTQIAYRGYTELGLDFFYTVRSFKLPVNANFTVNLPSNYLNYCKVGVFNDRSEVIPLIYNDKLTFFDDLQPNRAAATEDSTLFSPFLFSNLIFYNFWNGSVFDSLYGIPSGAPFVGSFKIDNQNGLIVLDENFCYPYVILECICTPDPKQGTYYLPVQFKEALIAYIGWKDIQMLPSSRRGSAGDKAQRRKEFYNERRLAIARYDPIRLEDAYENSLRNQRLVVKS